jgi:phenol 2-monooxygenase
MNAPTTAGNLEVERAVRPFSLEIDKSKVDDPDAYPVTVQLQHLTEEEATPSQFGPTADGLFRSYIFKDDELDAKPRISPNAGNSEVVHAKYVLGCDGARSWTRTYVPFLLMRTVLETHLL